MFHAKQTKTGRHYPRMRDFFCKTTNKSTQTSFATDCHTHVLQCTVYCRIAEVKISDQTKDVDPTEKVHISLENQTNIDR